MSKTNRVFYHCQECHRGDCPRRGELIEMRDRLNFHDNHCPACPRQKCPACHAEGRGA